MTSNLLQKEKEFYKLNNELENKTKQLRQEVNIVMDNICREVPQVQKFNYTFKYNKKGPTDDVLDDKPHQTVSKISEVIPDDDLAIPESVNEMGVKGMSHFFRAKIKKMQNDYERLQADYKTKRDEFKKLQKDNQKLAEEKDKWFQISTGYKAQINKLESQISSITSRLQSKESENASLKKECEQLQKDLKNEMLTASNAESKMKKLTEECEKQRACIKNAKQEEKDLRESHRKQINDMTSIIKKIEKHKMEILNGFKKQLVLIDNLKKQKALIECFKLTDKADNDFLKLLDWKPDS